MSDDNYWRAELHCHTYYSRDCRMRPAEMVRACQERGVNVLAVTDHNEFGAHEEIQAIAPFVVIPGEEVRTTEGEVIGYFMTERIPKGLSALETAQRIKDQGGVVSVPHPFDSLRGGCIKLAVLDQLLEHGLVDMIEVFNARMSKPSDNDRAYEYARRHGLSMTAGSDAHTYAEIGSACVELRPFNGPEEFVEAVRQGRLVGALSPWPVHFASTWAKVAKKVGLR